MINHAFDGGRASGSLCASIRRRLLALLLALVSAISSDGSAHAVPIASGASAREAGIDSGWSPGDPASGDLLAVDYEENGIVQSAMGFVVDWHDRFANVQLLIAGRMATKTIVRTDLRRAEVKAEAIRGNEAAWTPEQVSSLADKSRPVEMRISSGLRSIAARCGSIDLNGRTVILRLDASAASAEETLLLLHALREARARGVKVIAVFEQAEGNAAVIALACDAMIPVGAGIIRANRRTTDADDPVVVLLAGMGSELGYVDRQLPLALLGVSGGLGWSAEADFSAKADELSIATPETPARLEAESLVRTALASTAAGTEAEAIALVESGVVRPRGPRERAEPLREASEAPRGRSTAEASESRRAAIASAVAEYNAALRTIHADIPEFNLYFTGQKGVWTEQLKSLRAIWERKAEMTAHVNTQMEVARLQKSMLRCVGVMENLGRRLQLMIGDHGHPTLAEHRRRLEVFLLFKGAVLRNRADDYVRSSSAIASLKSLPAPGR